MRKIIGITGKARTGKDTAAEYLWRQYGFTRLAFADPVKLAAQVIFGLSRQQTWDSDEKEKLVPYWDMTPRRMFQVLGTDLCRKEFGEDVWVKRLAMDMAALPGDDIVIPDVRFENEAEFIRLNGGRILHMTRDAAPRIDTGWHPSEAGVEFDGNGQDETLLNNGDRNELYGRIDKLIQEWGWEDDNGI